MNEVLSQINPFLFKVAFGPGVYHISRKSNWNSVSISLFEQFLDQIPLASPSLSCHNHHDCAPMTALLSASLFITYTVS